MFNNTIFGIIYLIKHKTCDDKKVYVGSTNNLKQRIKKHEEGCYYEKSKKNNINLYKYIRQNGGFNEYQFIILECYVCNFKYELHYKEDDYIKMYDNNLNSKRAYLTRGEKREKHNKMRRKNNYDKRYYDNNKEIVLNRCKEYREQNKDKINEKAKKKYDENKENESMRSKKYYDENKEKINKKITCECGSIVSKHHITTHRKTLKHIQYIEKK